MNDATKSDTTEDIPVDRGRPDLRALFPSLVLAHAELGGRPPEVRWIPPAGVILGRGTEFFPSGPLVDGRMSREHAALRREGGGWVLTDMGSRNGTWIGGQRLHRPTELSRGDVIRLGDTCFVFTECSPDAEQSAQESGLVGVSELMSEVRRSIQAVATGAESVLITGETGTGKELAAQALHRLSGRRGPLLAVNCGAIAEGVLASELFGHIRGAFTGATQSRDGLFRAASGGTLFLDEVGETPPSLQVQLLRALETRSIRPVGATLDLPVDVRIVAATNKDLPAAVRAGTFRADLFARLAQWPVHLPPLRERTEDIPWLIRALLGRRGGLRLMTPDLAERLLQHRWPFNVRGLANLLSMADIASPRPDPLRMGPEIEATMSREDQLHHEAEPPARGAPASPSDGAIEAALIAAGGKVSDAAHRLGITRQHIYRWAKVRGVDLSVFRG